MDLDEKKTAVFRWLVYLWVSAVCSQLRSADTWSLKYAILCIMYNLQHSHAVKVQYLVAQLTVKILEVPQNCSQVQ